MYVKKNNSFDSSCNQNKSIYFSANEEKLLFGEFFYFYFEDHK